jgi:hypothetical protein
MRREEKRKGIEKEMYVATMTEDQPHLFRYCCLGALF